MHPTSAALRHCDFTVLAPSLASRIVLTVLTLDFKKHLFLISSILPKSFVLVTFIHPVTMKRKRNSQFLPPSSYTDYREIEEMSDDISEDERLTAVQVVNRDPVNQGRTGTSSARRFQPDKRPRQLTKRLSEEKVLGSRFESLPAEILEMIAWFSLNPQLTKVSKTVRSKLPSAVILKVDMITAAFCQWKGATMNQSLLPMQSHVARNHHLSSNLDADQPLMQQQLLEDPSITVSDFMQSKSLITAAWLRVRWKSVEKYGPFTLSLANADAATTFRLKGTYATNTAHDHQIAFDRDGAIRIVRLWVSPRNIRHGEPGSSGPLFKRFRSAHDILALKNVEAKRKSLYLLYDERFAGYIHYWGPFSPQLALTALRDAVSSNDKAMLCMLLVLVDLETYLPYRRTAPHTKKFLEGWHDLLPELLGTAAVHGHWSTVRMLIEVHMPSVLDEKLLATLKAMMILACIGQDDREAARLLEWCEKLTEIRLSKTRRSAFEIAEDYIAQHPQFGCGLILD